MLSLIGKLLGSILLIGATLIGSHWISWRGITVAKHGERIARALSGYEIPEKIKTIGHDLTEVELSPDDKKALFGLISDSKKK